MPHGQFDFISFHNDDTLIVVGSSHHDLEFISAINVAVISLDDPGKRTDAEPIIATRHAKDAPNVLTEDWSVKAPAKVEGSDAFKPDELVVVIGSSTHRHPEEANPFLWHGFFKIQAVGGNQVGEQQLCVCDP